MLNSSSISSLITQSNILTAEKKQVYTQILSYLSPEASSQLEAILTKAEKKIQEIKNQGETAISETNIKASEEMEELVRNELKTSQIKQETNESNAAETLLNKFNNL